MITGDIAMPRTGRPFSREAGWRAPRRAGACGRAYQLKARKAHLIDDLIDEQFYFRLIERNLFRPDVVRHIGPHLPHELLLRHLVEQFEMNSSMIRACSLS